MIFIVGHMIRGAGTKYNAGRRQSSVYYGVCTPNCYDRDLRSVVNQGVLLTHTVS